MEVEHGALDVGGAIVGAVDDDGDGAVVIVADADADDDAHAAEGKPDVDAGAVA